MMPESKGQNEKGAIYAVNQLIWNDSRELNIQ